MCTREIRVGVCTFLIVKKKKGIIEPKGRAWNEQASGEAIEYGGGGLSFPL